MEIKVYTRVSGDERCPEILLLDSNALDGTYYKPLEGTLNNGIYTDFKKIENLSSWASTLGQYTLVIDNGVESQYGAEYEYSGNGLVYKDEFIPLFNYKADYVDGTGKCYELQNPSGYTILSEKIEVGEPIYAIDGNITALEVELPKDKYDIPYFDANELIKVGEIISLTEPYPTGRIYSTNEEINLMESEIKCAVIK